MAKSVDRLVNTGQGAWMDHAVLPLASHTRFASVVVVPADTFFLIAGLALAGTTTAFILLIRAIDQEQRDRRRTAYELVFPQGYCVVGLLLVTASTRSCGRWLARLVARAMLVSPLLRWKPIEVFRSAAKTAGPLPVRA